MKPHRLITIAAALMLSMAFCSCKVVRASRPVRESLRTLKPLLLRSEKVDSCLEVLRGIDTTLLTRPSDKAKYALLHAMALDKNYIDTTDLSVIEPAVQYYTAWYRPGKADKFYTWYYKGRIEENARKFDAALHSFLEAERVMGGTDDLYRSRLYTSFGRIYIKTLSRQDSYSSFQKALYYAKKTGQMRPYGAALCDCSETASYLSHPNDAQRYLQEYEHEVLHRSMETYEYYLRSKFLHFLQIDQKDSLAKYLTLYLDNTSQSDFLPVAKGYVQLHQYGKAVEFLENYENTLIEGEKPGYSYYAFRADIKEVIGDYGGALADVRIHDKILSESYLFNLDREITSIASQYHSKLEKRTITLSLLLIISILVISYMVYASSKRQEKRRLLMKIEDAQRSYQRLYHLISGKGSETMVDKDDIALVSDTLLDYGSGISKRRNNSIKEILDSMVTVYGAKRTVSLISLFAAVYCSRTFKELQDKGLDDFETGFSFLLMMGFKIKELEPILDRWNLKNVSLGIRKKLDIKDKNELLSSRLMSILHSR